MRIALFICAVLAPVLAAVPTYAKTATPTLPAAAKKLTGLEIVTLYDGNTFDWTKYPSGQTGVVSYDFKNKKASGTWIDANDKGVFLNKIRVSKDAFCSTAPKAKEFCNFIYTDGGDVYSVSAKGDVWFKLKKK